MIREVSEMWAETLGVQAVGPDDDFFKLGGDSLMATTLVALIEERFGVLLDPVDVFDFSVLSDFMAHLEGAIAAGGVAAAPASDDDLLETLF